MFLAPLEASTISFLSVQMNVKQPKNVLKALNFKDLSVFHCYISNTLQMLNE